MPEEPTESALVPQEDAMPVRPQYAGDNNRASWQISLDTLRTNLSHCSPEGKQSIIDSFLWCTDPKHSMHRDEFAARVSYSPNVIYKIMTGKYIEPLTKRQLDVPPKLIKAIGEFLALEKERALGGGRDIFVVTPTVKRIWAMCDLARESQTPVWVLGPSHVGKTRALEEYAIQNNHGRTIYVRMKAASGLGGMVRRIASKVGISDKGNVADLQDRIKNGLAPNMLLLIDELHLLANTYRKESYFACLEVLREIYDEVKCGVVFCGTRLKLESLVRAGQHGEMEQLVRRGVHKLILPDHVSLEDVRMIVAQAGLSLPSKRDKVTVQVGKVTEEPYEICRQLAKNEGLLALSERIRYAHKLAAKAGTKVSWQHFCQAHLIIQSSVRLGEQEGWE